MPDRMWIEPNPAFQPENAAQKAEMDAVKAVGPKHVYVGVAMEAVRQSRGMYRIRPARAEAEAPTRELKDMTIPELKQMAVTMGFNITKQMKKSELVAFLQKKIDAIDVVDDDEE